MGDDFPGKMLFRAHLGVIGQGFLNFPAGGEILYELVVYTRLSRWRGKVLEYGHEKSSRA
jgi:hypothetical protein